MKKLFHKIKSNKKLTRALIAIFVIIACVCAYTLYGIYKNVKKMAAAQQAVEYFPKYPAMTPIPGKSPEMIKRGEYLAKAGDCIACHTNTTEKGPAYAGGLPMPTPFGTIYSPNITPDKETGLGNWTEEQFIKAMREGIAPDGHYYYPAFPYLYFSKITDEDLKALKAYLDSIPAVKMENKENDMVFPFNIRFLQLGWRLIFFYPEDRTPFTKDPHQSEKWNRGAYLTNGLGHCAMCHSPSYNLFSDALPLGAPIRKYDLTGAKVQGYLAPNISSSNLANIPEHEIIEVFTKDKMIGGGKVEGPMLEVNRDSLSYLSDEDLSAIAHYLKSVQSATPPKPKGGPGKGIYDTYCSGCHATGAGGAPKYGDAASWDPVMKEGIENVYLNAIKGKGSMPAKGTCLSCTDEEIKQSVDYMIAAITGEAGKTVVNVPKMKELTMEDGKRIYDKNCSTCHATGKNGAPIPGKEAAWTPIIDQGFIDTYINVATGQKGHPARGACPTCTDSELKAAVKYMMDKSSSKNYNLW